MLNTCNYSFDMMVNKKYLVLMFLMVFSVILFSACEVSEETVDAADVNETNAGIQGNAADGQNVETVVAEEELIVEEVELVIEDVTCSVSDDCAWNEYCIEGVCGQTSKIYNTDGDCDSKCNFNNVQITTSDGDEMTLSRGQGSYTAAGAVEWKLLSSADYCLGEDPTPVAVELIKKNYGKIIAKEVVVLEVGEESDSVTHPDIASIDFTLEVTSIDETCE